MVEETTICLQCGDRGYENAFVYCIRCLNFAVHRYCLDVLPDSFDEFVSWLCDDCNLKERKQSGVLDHDAIPSQTSRHEVSKNIKGFSENGNKKNGLVVAETNKHVCENGTEQTYDAGAKSDLVECGESASQHTPAPVEFPAGCLTQKKMKFKIKFKIKTRGINIRESTTEKDQDRLATVSYDESLKVDLTNGTISASDSSLPSKVKENEFFQQKDQTCLSKPFDSITDLGIAGVHADQDANAILLPEYVSKRSQHQEENVEGNPIEQKRRKFMIRIKRREINFSESTTEKDQGRLSTACNDECSKVDIIECTRSASDSTLPSKGKENEFSEQNDQLCVSKPSDAITDLDIAGVPADHPVISSNEPSVALKYDGNGILLPADVSNRSQLEEEKVEGNLIDPIELSAGCLKQKKTKMIDSNLSESTTEKDQGILSTACNDECLKEIIIECTRPASGSTLPSKVKENEFSEQKDQLCASKPFVAITDPYIAGVPADHPVISSNGPSEGLQNDGNGVLLPADVSNQSQLEEDKVKGNLIEPFELSAGYLKQKKKKTVRNFSESTSEKDQDILSTACNDECSKVDMTECTRSASNSTLPSKVKENEFSEQKDQLCVSKPFAAITDPDIVVVPADHPVISSNGPSVDLTNDGNVILLPTAGVSKQSQIAEEKLKGNLIEPIEGSAGCLKRKKKKKRNIVESTTEKHQHEFATASYDTRVEVDITECTRSASDSTLPSNVNKNKRSEQKDQTCVSKSFDSTTDLGIAVIPADIRKQSQLEEEEKIEGNLIEPIEISTVCLKQKKKKKRRKNIMDSTSEKDHGLATAFYDKCLKVDMKECTRSARESIFSSKAKENKFSEQKDQTCISKPFDSTTDLGIAVVPIGNPVFSCNESSMSLKTDGNGILLPADVNKRPQLEDEKIEGNLMEQIELSTGCLKRKKKKRNIVESTTEKDQHGLATTSYGERVNEDINECSRSASDSTFLSKVKENECSEQKDQTRVSKPFDSTTDLDIAVLSADHPVISSNGSSMCLKNDGNVILLPADVSKRSQFEEKKIEGNLMKPIELSAGFLKRKKKKKSERTTMESTTEKDQRGLATTSFDECVKVDITECKRSASDSTLPTVVKENKCSEQKDRMHVSKPFDSTNQSQLEEEKIEGNLIEPIDLSAGCLKRKKKKRKRNTMESTTKKDQHGVATPSYDECVKVDKNQCTRSASDSTLPSKVKENKCSEKKDHMCVSKPLDSTKRSQLEKEKIEGNLIEPIDLSAGCLKRKKKKRKRSIMKSSTGKDQYGVVTSSYDECVKVDNECTRSASDSRLPSKVKEKKCSEKKDHMCVSKPLDSTKRSQLEEEKIEGNLIEPIDLSAGCLKRKKKKRKRNILESTSEKDQHGVATSSYDERVKVDYNECTRSVSDSTLPSKVKENKCSEKKDHMCLSKPLDSTKRSQLDEEKIEGNLIEPIDLSAGCLMRKKKKKTKRLIMESTTEKDQHGFATASCGEHVKVDINECTRSASDSTLPSKVKENECSEQNDHKFVFKPFDSITDLGIAGVPADQPVTLSNRSSRRLQKKKTITSLETFPLEQLHQTRVAQPLQKNRTLYAENEFSDLITEERVLRSSKDPIENREPEVKEEKTFTTCESRDACKYNPKNLGFSVAQPFAVPIWRGSFSIWNEKYDNIDLLMAHISNKACHKVYEATSQFQPVLRLEMRPKSDLWPTSFQTAEPNGDNIGLYFFPSKMSEQVYEQLVGEMIHKELAFRAFLQNAELLIFTSTELPLLYWTFRSKYYLWGVFRGKQPPPSSNALSSEGEFA